MELRVDTASFELRGVGQCGVITYTKKTTADRLIFRFLSPPDSSEIIDANASRTEVSIDYVATGIPKAGDQFGDVLYLDDASPWSLSLVLVLPLAPLNP